MDWDDSCPLVTQKECSVSCKRLLLNWDASLSNFNTANTNVIFVQILLSLFKIPETIKVYLLICTMISKNMELFHGLHLFAIIRFICDVYDLLKTECASTTYDASDVVFLSNIVEEKVTFGDLFLHFFYNQLLVFYKIQLLFFSNFIFILLDCFAFLFSDFINPFNLHFLWSGALKILFVRLNTLKKSIQYRKICKSNT